MSLPVFELHRPVRLSDALDLLAEYGEDCAFYMGGTELLLMMKLGFAEPTHLVDGKGLAELRQLKVSPECLTIGAGVTHRRLERHGDIRQLLPALSDLERRVANVRVRNVGTLGGNLCFAEPHSDPVTLLMALDASVTLASPSGQREMSLVDFWQGPFNTALGSGEVMVHLTLPMPAPGTRVGYQRLSFKERPTVAAAVVVGDEGCRVFVGALTGQPLRVIAAERALEESAGADVESAVAATLEAVDAADQAEGSDYRAHLAGVMVRRSLQHAVPGRIPESR